MLTRTTTQAYIEVMNKIRVYDELLEIAKDEGNEERRRILKTQLALLHEMRRQLRPNHEGPLPR